MNTKQLIAAAVVFAAAGSAFAQQTEFVAPDAGFVSSKTRADVVAELQQAYADGTLVQRDGADSVIVSNTHRSRDAVRAAAKQANQDQFNGKLYFGA